MVKCSFCSFPCRRGPTGVSAGRAFSQSSWSLARMRMGRLVHNSSRRPIIWFFYLHMLVVFQRGDFCSTLKTKKRRFNPRRPCMFLVALSCESNKTKCVYGVNLNNTSWFFFFFLLSCFLQIVFPQSDGFVVVVPEQCCKQQKCVDCLLKGHHKMDWKEKGEGVTFYLTALYNKHKPLKWKLEHLPIAPFFYL